MACKTVDITISYDAYNSDSVAMVNHVKKRITIGHLFNGADVLEAQAKGWSRKTQRTAVDILIKYLLAKCRAI